MLFSQRKGLKKVRDLIQLDSMDDALRTGLWNVMLDSYWNRMRKQFLYEDLVMQTYVRRLYADYFKQSTDTIDNRWAYVLQTIRDYFFQCYWYEVYDFIEFTVGVFTNDSLNRIACGWFNQILERECSAYRFVSNKIMEITSEEEIAEIEQALQGTSTKNMSSLHLRRGLELLVDRNSPDYRNSIKESISAIESLCVQISGNQNATLGAALNRIEKSGNVQLHGALKDAFSKLYGYTSDADGIRHALMSETTLAYEDAKFMLVTCSAFVNYMKVKAENGGVKID